MRDRLVRALVRQKFVFSLKSGEAFEGILADADRMTLRLVSAALIQEHGQSSVDGELFIPRADVLYMQKVGA